MDFKLTVPKGKTMNARLFSVATALMCTFIAGLVVLVVNELFNGGISGVLYTIGEITLVISLAALAVVLSVNRLDSSM